MWAIDIATLFLMLTSDAMMATDENEENSKTISLSNWMHDLLYFSLLNRLKEMQSEKLSITLRPEENSEFKGLKNGKHSLTLLAKSTKWLLTRDCCLLVKESRVSTLRSKLELSHKSISNQIKWLGGSLQVHSWGLPPSFWRWRLIDINPAIVVATTRHSRSNDLTNK